MPHHHPCEAAAGRARRGVRPPAAGRSSASWPGPTASASGPSSSWPPTCSGLSISTGMICRLERQGAAELEAPVEGLREHVRTAASAHIDETSWWQGRDKMWLWAAVTKSATVFTIARSRGADVARGHARDRPPGRWSSAIGSRATPGSSDASSAGPTPSERNRQIGRAPGVSSGPRPSPSPGPEAPPGRGLTAPRPRGPAG